jgi:hypothetical protein
LTLPARGAGIALALAALAVVVGASPGYVLHGIPLGDDNSSHFAEISYVAELLRAGQTDFWFDQTNLGYPLFLAYQPAPALLMGVAAAVLPDVGSRLALFKLSILLLWAAMPLAWYVGGRWLGLDRLTALLFGLMSLSVSDFRSFGLGIASATGTGLYTQTWGMLLLPLSLGSLLRHVIRREIGPLVPTLLFAATFLCHAFFGMYAGIAAALMTVVEPRRSPERIARLALVSCLTLLLIAWWLIPFVANIEYQGGLPWRGASEDGYPLADVLRWLVGGSLFDHGRAPWLSALVLLGAALAAVRWNRSPVSRWALLLMLGTLALMLGRTTWGRAYTLIPFHGELEVIRYLSGLHFCGLLLAGGGAAWLLETAAGWLTRQRGPGWLTPDRTRSALIVAVVGGYLAGAAATSRAKFVTADPNELRLPEIAAALGNDLSSRFLCHEQLETSSHYYLNMLAVMAGRPQLESFSRGYHDTLSLYYLEYFDFSESAFRLYNVGAAVARGEATNDHPPFMRRAWSGGDASVFETGRPGGYFEFVRTPLTVVGSTRGVRETVRLLVMPLYRAGVLPRISGTPPAAGDWIEPRPGARALLHTGEGDAGTTAEPLVRLARRLVERHRGPPAASRVLEEMVATNIYRARVEATGGEERLLLKVSAHPYWQAAVDGERVPIDHVAPSMMAVDVPAGAHEIVFRYRNPAVQKLGFAASLLAAGVWSFAATARRRRGGSID